MITRKTVLVLGAGASHSFDDHFPLGRDLVFAICDALSQGTVRQRMQHWVSMTDAQIFDIRGCLLGSGQSIDQFLQNHPEEDIHVLGKVGIALALIPCERRNQIAGKEAWEKWYQVLIEQMGIGDPAEFRQNVENLSFVTFNYDRSLEYFLYQRLTAAFDEKTALDLLDLIRRRFVHVYGQLGEPHFWKSNGPKVRDYHDQGPEAQISDSEIEKCISSIQTIPKGSITPGFQDAHELIKDAQVVCFLGFGYDRKNIEYLGLEDHFKGESIDGTMIKRGYNEIAQTEDLFGHILPRKTKIFTCRTSWSENITPFLKDNPIFR